jgi:hypothetical protein
MKRFVSRFVFLIGFAAAASTASAQQTGSLTVFYSPSGSSLEVPALTGPVPDSNPPAFKFTNDAHYGGIFGDTLLVKRVGVAGYFKWGTADDIPGGAVFTDEGLPGPQFNPTTGEKAHLLDVSGTFALIKTGAARLDATAGYFYLHAKPEISIANSYGGPSLGFRTKYIFANGLDVHGNLSIVPTFFVHGNVEHKLGDDSVIQYRLGADYGIGPHFGVSAGYDGFQLTGQALQPNPLIQYFGDTAAVTLSGFYFGGQAKW